MVENNLKRERFAFSIKLKLSDLKNGYLVNTSNSKLDIKSLQVKSIVDFKAIASIVDSIGCT